MALKKFKPQPKHTKKVKSPRVRIYSKGLVTFSKSLAKFLGLKDGSGVDFFQDDENKKDWYLQVNAQSETKVRKKGDSDVILFNDVRLASAILDSSGATDEGLESFVFPVSTQPTEFPEGTYYALFTGAVEKIKKK